MVNFRAVSQATTLSAELLRQLFDFSSAGVGLVEPREWRLIYANRTLLSWLGQATSNSLLDWFLNLGNRTSEVELKRLLGREIDEAAFSTVLPNRGRAEVRVRRMEVEGQLLLGVCIDRIAQPVSAFGSVERIDPLTGLADRTRLMERLGTLLSGDRAADPRSAVLFIDVDGFKQINDGHGHLVGDRVLCEVARRLASCVRSADLVARFGGDEFVVLLERVATDAEIQPVVDRLHAAFVTPIALVGSDIGVTLSVSIGVAELDGNSESANELIHAADRAMYVAKQSRGDALRPVAGA